jgi:hypothetical protein
MTTAHQSAPLSIAVGAAGTSRQLEVLAKKLGTGAAAAMIMKPGAVWRAIAMQVVVRAPVALGTAGMMMITVMLMLRNMTMSVI